MSLIMSPKLMLGELVMIFLISDNQYIPLLSTSSAHNPPAPA